MADKFPLDKRPAALGAGLFFVVAVMDSPLAHDSNSLHLPRPQLSRPAAPAPSPEPAPSARHSEMTRPGLSWESRFRPLSENEKGCLARNVFFEARGESVAGQVGVTMVVLNRLRSAAYPGNACAVIRDSAQFSWVWDGRPDNPRAYRSHPDRRAWKQAKRIARQVVEGSVRDLTHGSDHYHALEVDPSWAREMALQTELGNHRFYTADGADHDALPPHTASSSGAPEPGDPS
ncbi:cell wall hydrolase [Thiohalorhabdus methylotrophus]|uniref:Cell wall hydrolase n=1 Tax=Thiohalorhabdus methylotrophus TaxID=3242694 RepID=A0ABV4TXN8_9GAMM